ncbi:MAG: NAD-dependent deacetylase [Mycobacterium sp.]|jgi:NAD-dependent deacetylase|nr:NAD-dependent deacetylase [Mycobacterium sp.]MDT5131784.1 NAD-dependent deacetylase [Mycobacterium sp.]
MSAESGIATFRDAQTGLWETFDPEELASPRAWRRQPDVVWAWYLWRHHLVSSVEPNPGHMAVADWQQRADVRVVTQNIDDLHERAGSGQVAHLHGSLFEFRCSRCGSRYVGDVADMAEPVESVAPPLCECGGMIRPGVVWFGEELPDEPWQRAVEAVAGADVLIVVGTSGIVYPAAGLPSAALAQGIPVIEINPDSTPLSGSATATIRDTAARALPGLLDRLDELIG